MNKIRIILILFTICLLSYGLYDCLYTHFDELPLKISIYAIIILFCTLYAIFLHKVNKKIVSITKCITKPIFVISIITIGALSGIGFGTYKVIETNSLPACDSKFAENEVIEIFKQNNSVYKNLSQYNQISDILFSPQPISYDKSINKYECSARITLLPSKSAGLPKQVSSGANGDNIPRALHFYSEATCTVHYSIYKTNGENSVSSSYCANTFEVGDAFDWKGAIPTGPYRGWIPIEY